MPKTAPQWLLGLLDLLFGSISAYVLWPICASAFHGPFESQGFLIIWPVSIAVASIPLFYFISAFRLTAQKKSGFTFLFIANGMLLSVLVLFSLCLQLGSVSPQVNVHEARIIRITYFCTGCVAIFSILSIWLFNCKRERASFRAAK